MFFSKIFEIFSCVAGLSVDAAEWLASYGKRNGQTKGIIGVGVDTLSLDPGQSVKYESHVALLKHNIFGIENMANLDKVKNNFLI